MMNLDHKAGHRDSGDLADVPGSHCFAVGADKAGLEWTAGFQNKAGHENLPYGDSDFSSALDTKAGPEHLPHHDFKAGLLNDAGYEFLSNCDLDISSALDMKADIDLDIVEISHISDASADCNTAFTGSIGCGDDAIDPCPSSCDHDTEGGALCPPPPAEPHTPIAAATTEFRVHCLAEDEELHDIFNEHLCLPCAALAINRSWREEERSALPRAPSRAQRKRRSRR